MFATTVHGHNLCDLGASHLKQIKNNNININSLDSLLQSVHCSNCTIV